MSPERYDGVGYTYTGDVWSLGITLIESITGAYPYEKMNGFFEQMNSIQVQESPNVPDNQFYSQELRDFISRCLIKDPKERATTHELLAHPWILKYTQSQANLPQYFKYL